MDWLDHLNATLVAGGVLLAASVVFLISTDDSVDDVRLHSAQVTQDAITQQIEIDFENIGAQRPAGASPVVDLGPSSIVFHGVADTLGTPALMEYRAEHIAGDSTAARYRVQRYVDGVKAGQSSDLVTRFELIARDADGTALGSENLSSVASLDVRMQWALPFDADTVKAGALPKRIGWTTSVRPVALRYTY